MNPVGVDARRFTLVRTGIRVSGLLPPFRGAMREWLREIPSPGTPGEDVRRTGERDVGLRLGHAVFSEIARAPSIERCWGCHEP